MPDLTGLVIAIERDILTDRIGRYERADDWQSASAFRRLLLGGSFENLLVMFGRSALKGHSHAAAARVLTAAAALFPQSFEANYQAGLAKSLQGELDRALNFLKAADSLEEGDARAKHAMVNLFGRILKSPMSPEQRAEMRAEHLELLGALSSSENASFQARYRVPFATALYGAGRYDEAAAIVDGVLAIAPNDVKALAVRAKLLVARNEVAEARAIYEHIIELDRDSAAARLGLKALSGLVTAPKVDNPEAGADIWICTSASAQVSPEVMRTLGRKTQRESGYTQIAALNGEKLDFWRSDVLAGLRVSGLIKHERDTAGLARWKGAYDTRRSAASANLVAVMYQVDEREQKNERFARRVAAHHAHEGLEPVIVGLKADFMGRETTGNGFRHVLIGNAVADVRGFLLENDISLAHAIAETCFTVAKAIRFTNMAFVCGLDIGKTPSSLSDKGPPGEAEYSRQDLSSIFERADAVYANSRFAQKVLEGEFGVRCPIISSVPPD